MEVVIPSLFSIFTWRISWAFAKATCCLTDSISCSRCEGSMDDEDGDPKSMMNYNMNNARVHTHLKYDINYNSYPSRQKAESKKLEGNCTWVTKVFSAVNEILVSNWIKFKIDTIRPGNVEDIQVMQQKMKEKYFFVLLS